MPEVACNRSEILPEQKRLEVDAVLKRTMELFPGAVISCEDLYDREPKRKLAAMRDLEREGKPVRNPKLILNSIEEKKASFGVAKSIALPCDDGSVTGVVRERSLGFHTESAFDSSTKEKLVLLFEELELDFTFSSGPEWEDRDGQV